MVSPKITISLLVFVSFILLMNASGVNVYAQQSKNQTNQTGAPILAPYAEDQLQRIEKQVNLLQQEIQQMQQSQPQTNNQTNQSIGQNMTQQQSQPQMKEKLLNYTNTAIIALENDDESVVQQNLVNIQETLLNATDKQIVVVPAPDVQSD